MPTLIKNISASLLDDFEGNIQVFSSVIGNVQLEDYVSVYGLIAYLQDFSETPIVNQLKKPLNFGLNNQYKQPTITLEISYQ